MRKREKIRGFLLKILYGSAVLGMMMGASACGEKNNGASVGTNYYHNSVIDTQDTQSIEIPEAEKELYLIVAINSAKENMRVYRFANGLEYQCYYGMTTEFCNKYGDHTSVANFRPGDVVYLSEADQEGRVKTVTKSDEVWVYDDITRYSIDTDINKLEIADSNYKIDEDTHVFSGAKEIKLEEIGDEDILQVVGLDNRVLSVSVMTGHGQLQLSNTELFEGSYLQLNNDIFVEITKDMDMELPEGKYRLVVANNGWGGSKNITIKRGKTTKVNLDKLKGEGPKAGHIQFVVDVEGAQILIDDKPIDYASPVDIIYGEHSLVVIAEGYETWNRKLFVNSEEATIIINLQEGKAETKPDKPGDTEKKDSNNSNNSNNSESGNKSSESSDNSNKNEKDDLTDYLSTLAELLNSIH